jgi:hypothetical protein
MKCFVQQSKTQYNTPPPHFGKIKMKRCTGEKRAAVTVIPLLASTRKKKNEQHISLQTSSDWK